MTRRLFDRIFSAICAHDPFFQQKPNATKKLDLSGLQKVSAALRQMVYRIGADATDEYCRLAESTSRKALYRFYLGICELSESTYLRKPETSDVLKSLHINEQRGFPGMFASLDCMRYEWKNCPVAWQGQFTDKDGNKSIVLEAIADQELWIWHAFLGLPGGNNDLNVLDRSPLVNDILHRQYDSFSYVINGREYKRAYLLVDGIYPKWSCFVIIIHQPQSEKKSFYAKCQESARKDVERAFGVLQARWRIVKQPARSWHLERVHTILMASIILHNMIIEDERGEDHEDFRVEGGPMLVVRRGSMPWKDYLAATIELESHTTHFQLRNDLIEHLWQRRGEVRVADWARATRS
ncbi:unnamed protein product [Calypogeia fissa]